ncbi:hypothetical protein A9A89_1336 [Bifidobacterium psychraerophilum DSM 22366]|uniref:Uncharacterized protein n=1 Tax=Bifidobacterium psychraerophilum TaxID=218140 RepID=A0A087CG89_9BIFI|nr:hypothetical protein BPSY_1140 [Bifidobacterium psychraerophilum]PKA95091.1 hypothetical protein A9A89_1336 [Bifidobacterium psychraerophilum DSM 22366]
MSVIGPAFQSNVCIYIVTSRMGVVIFRDEALFLRQF